uniref:Resolvase, Holliday junction-type n=1 Tax=uncultured marine thaumarchaeote KM3_64_C01 TaxID=1456221 RepID=A0A075HB73_9ARCH|nr:resolvase, Holliday junction-type [uncultured marine thaumarchaeote KM3_64_C01]
MSILIRKNQNLISKDLNEYEKIKKINKKIARTRRQRGYNWEDTLVKRFNSIKSWKAFRLGSPSVALPDVLSVNNVASAIFTIEAKSGTGTTLFVPFDQIERCLNWINTFQVYQKREVILAFKFLSKKRIGTGKYEKRELREFYKVWDKKKKVIGCVCTYDGKTYALKNGKQKKLVLKDFLMPFKSKYQLFYK